MAILKKNEKGITAINNELLRSIIIDEIKKNESSVLCNKKGVPVKKTIFGGSEDNKNSVIIRDNKDKLNIIVYLLAKDEQLIDSIVEDAFNKVFIILNTICINRKSTVTCTIKGIIDDEVNVQEMNLELSKIYEQE